MSNMNTRFGIQMKFRINIQESSDEYYICKNQKGKHKVIEGPYKDITSSGFREDYKDIYDEFQGKGISYIS